MENRENKKVSKKILLGTIFGYISLAINIAAGLFFTPWIIRTIGSSQYGIYSLTTSIVSLFLIDFGLSATANTFLSKHRANNDIEGMQKTLGIIYKLYFIIDAILFIGLVFTFLFSKYIFVGLVDSEIKDFRIAFTIIALFSLISFPATTLNGVISAYEEFPFLKASTIIQRVLYVATTTICIICGLGLFALVICNVGSALICTIIKYIYVRAKLKVKSNLRIKLTKKAIIPILSFSVWTAIQSFCARIPFNLTPGLLGIVSDSTNIAVFGVISTIEGYVYIFGTIMSGFFMTRIATIKKENPDNFSESLSSFASKYGKLQFVLTSLVVVGFIAVGKDFVNIWMKGDSTYNPVYLGVVILIVYEFLFTPLIVFYNAMMIVNKVKQLALSELVANSIYLPLAFRFGADYGAFGVCIAIIVSRIISIILYIICFKKYLNVDMTQFFKRVYLRGTLTSVISITAGIITNILLRDHSAIFRLFISGSITVLFFALCTLFISFTTEERKSFVFSRLRKKRNA